MHQKPIRTGKNNYPQPKKQADKSAKSESKQHCHEPQNQNNKQK